MQKILEISRNFINCNNFSKYSLIFAFSIILAENKYIFTYLIRISIKMTQNKYTYKKKVSRRNPAFVGDSSPVYKVTMHNAVYLQAEVWL